ncbi:MAG: hypothetical protein ABIQ44_09810 [Chloroflexia bacterium]
MIPFVAVVALGGATLGFALFVGKWIDAQGATDTTGKGDKSKRDPSDKAPRTK